MTRAFRSAAILLFLFPLALAAQEPPEPPGPPSVPPGVYFPPDTGQEDSTYEEPYYEEEDVPVRRRPPFGVDMGLTAEIMSMPLEDLDPGLKGNPVHYGFEWTILFGEWVFGGSTVGLHVYDLSSNYDRFDFSYAGFLLGYERELVPGVRLRLGSGLGEASVEMVKKRPDLSGNSDYELLELYRREKFLYLRPGASLGFSALGAFSLRAAVNYMHTVGGRGASDFKHLSYGLHLMLSIREPNNSPSYE